jgi:hypothetical protein
MDINEQTSSNVGHCLLNGSKLGIMQSSTGFWWDWSPIRFRFRKLIKNDMSRENIQEQG